MQLTSSFNIQQLLEPQIKLSKVLSNHYFILINKKYNLKALSFRKSQKYTEEHAILSQIDENDIQQIFQIQQIHDGKFEIVHSVSTLIFTKQEREVMLEFGNWKDQQFFYPLKIQQENQKLLYSIKSSKSSNELLYYDGFALRCEKIDPNDESAIWQIRLCLHNKLLNRTCWIQYAFSNQVIDVPGATEKPGTQLIQYPCNYRFNQRFFIEEFKETLQKVGWKFNQKLFRIQSLKTSQYITVYESTFSTSVVQEPQTKQKHILKQLWRIQYVGNGLYIIKSALSPNLYLAVKDRSTRSQQLLCLTDIEKNSLWKIVGNFNIMPNKDEKF